MTPAELIANYPRLYHMAHQGGWPSIRDQGLMSASALLDKYNITGEQRQQLECLRRPELVTLERDGLPNAVLRDQKPLRSSALAKCLTHGLTPTDWYQILNAKNFFWLSSGRIWRLLGARAYRAKPQTVLTIETASVIAKYEPEIRLSPINSGSTLFDPQPRGPGTFVMIAEFPFQQRAKTRSLENNVVELVIDHSVPDIAAHTLAVHEVKGDKILHELWRAERATGADHP